MLREKVNEFVEKQLEDYTHHKVRAPKVIHDTIWGSNSFMPYEIEVLDLPIFQRLRRINQVDVANLVFPSGNHNRFEHTLGVSVISEKMIDALKRKKENSPLLKGVEFEEILPQIRMAAIMHDCGHGPFSHISEEVYKDFDDMKEIIKEEEKFHGAKPHEVLSYLVITSEPFKEFFNKEIKEKNNVEVDLNFVGDIIIGNTEDNPGKSFLIDIINGAFDSDKLDYIQRDSYFTGIKMVLDLERLFHTIEVLELDKKVRLSVDISGVSTLEQILFNKMMLHSTIYHHHKIRAAECLFRSIFKEFIEGKGGKIFPRLKFDSAADFLYLTDDDVFGLAKRTESKRISKLASNLCNRNLPKRALVISAKTSTLNFEEENPDCLNFNKLLSICEDKDFVHNLKETIAEEANYLNGENIDKDDIWIDLPNPPTFKEGTQWPIKVIGAKDGYERLRDIFPVDDWTRVFSENKWQGYIFTWPKYRESVQKAAKNVLEQALNIKFNEYASILCKMDDQKGIEL